MLLISTFFLHGADHRHPHPRPLSHKKALWERGDFFYSLRPLAGEG